MTERDMKVLRSVIASHPEGVARLFENDPRKQAILKFRVTGELHKTLAELAVEFNVDIKTARNMEKAVMREIVQGADKGTIY